MITLRPGWLLLLATLLGPVAAWAADALPGADAPKAQGEMAPTAPAHPEALAITAVDSQFGAGAALGKYLTEQHRAYTDLTPYLQRGLLPLAGVKVLVVGSFVTDDARIRGALLTQRAALEAWLAAGGVLVEFGQQDATEPRTPWTPGGLLITRADPDFGQLLWKRTDHPLAHTPHELDAQALSGWKYRNWSICWEAITGWPGFELIASAAPNDSVGAIAEAAYGKGRLLVMSPSPDAMLVHGEGDTPQKAALLLDNLLAYLDAVVAGKGVTLKPTPAIVGVVGPGVPDLRVTLVPRPQSTLPALLAELGIKCQMAHGTDLPAADVYLVDTGADTSGPLGHALEVAAEGGGTVVELAQDALRRPSWLSDRRRAGRGGMPGDTVEPARPDHPLFSTPNLLTEARRGGWREGAKAFARQGFDQFLGWGVVARFGAEGAPAAVLERSEGRGRVVLVAADPAAAGDATDLPGQNARAFLANLLRFACDAARGKVPLVPPVTLPPRDLMKIGRQLDGTVLVPSDQILRPAGQQIEFPGRPLDLRLLPDGHTLAVLDMRDLRLIDATSGAIIANGKLDGGSSVAGLAATADGKRLFASNSKGQILSWSLEAGQLKPGATLKVPGGTAAGLLLSADERTLYAACSTGNSLVALDLAGGAAARQVPTGMAPFAVAQAHGKLYVTNWGGHRPKPGEQTAASAGSQVAVDDRTLARDGTVSVIDAATLAPVSELTVGLLPSGVTVNADGSRLYVANANSDTVSVIDTATDAVIETIAVRPSVGLPFGSATVALCLSGDGRRLFVASATNNAIAQVLLALPGQPSRVEGWIPTGWYPGAVALNSAGDRLFVANTKGVGSLSAASGHNSHQHEGSISLIPVPDTAQLAQYTLQTADNNRLNLALAGLLPPRPGIAPVPLPERHGEPSRIKHVIYIIRENRTYDQVLGDLPQGNGDPSLVHFGREVTPNGHALAEEFTLLDNFNCSGVLSADGHQWTNEAYVSSYLERMFGGFFRSYPYEGDDALAYSPTGFLWDNALSHGRTFRDYGEMVQAHVRPLKPGGRASFKAIHDDYVADGKLDDFEVRATSQIKALREHLCETTIGFPGSVPDIYRAGEFIRELKEFEAKGEMPNLSMMLLPCDHTAGTSPGMPTPRAAVADNDLALGRIVDAVSHSRFWADTAILVCQDDPQAGVDHVDGHRSPAFVISPYTPRGKVDSHCYTQVGMVKTIELLLGLPPMNQLDLAAEPMRGCFTGEPDLRPYTAKPNKIPLDEINPQLTTLRGSQLYWAQKSLEQDFDEVDEIDEDTLNRILWHACRGYDVAYPGDRVAGG